MELSDSRQFLKEIYSCVGKGSFVFAPEDRVPLDNLTLKDSKGQVRRYYAGGVHYDSFAGKVGYTLMDESGREVHSDDLRDVQSLPASQLGLLSGCVVRYMKLALERSLALADRRDNVIRNEVKMGGMAL